MNPYVRNLQRIEFIITMACTGRCKHCSEGEHRDHGEYIDANAAVAAMEQICRYYPITSMMTFGGEAMLCPEAVYTIHKAAAAIGIPKRQLITNGYFSKDPRFIAQSAQKLYDCGVNEILLSVDAFHQECIPVEPVRLFAEYAAKSGLTVKLSPAWLVSQEDDNPYNKVTRTVLRRFEDLKLPLGAGNVVFPSGNALKYLREYFPEPLSASSPYDDDPQDIRSIGISPNGDVLNSNLSRKGILDILADYKP